MAGNFLAQIALVRKATAERIDNACVSITRDVFNNIITLTPVGKAPRDNHPGLLVNNWNFTINTPDFSTTKRTAPNKEGPRRRMMGVMKKGTFLNKDNVAYMCNGLDYAWTAEYLGWQHTDPYRMVAKTAQMFANGSFKFSDKGRKLLPT